MTIFSLSQCTSSVHRPSLTTAVVDLHTSLANDTSDIDSRIDFYGPVIARYSRAQAIKEGTLIDISGYANAQGFTIPVAMTYDAYMNYVFWTDEDSERQCVQDLRGRAKDVLFMLRWQLKTKRITPHGLFTFLCIPRNPLRRGRTVKKVQLKALMIGGDNGNPVMTIMMPHED